LDAPFLRQRSLAFVRGQALRKLRRRARWTPDEVGLAIFGGIAIVISFLTLVFSLVVWRTRIVVAARELLALGPVGVLILGLIALVFVGPLAIALAARAVGATRTAVRLSAARRARVAERELAERIGLLALLDRAERSATVQAIEATELWSLGRGHFNRWVKDRYEVAARIRASWTERTALAGLPFFKGLSGQELDRIAARMRTQR